MELIRLRLEDEVSWGAAYERIKNVLIKGGTIVFPTDTIYGLGCDAMNIQAVQKIILIKRRDPQKSFPVFVRDISQARSISHINKAQDCFLKKAWPGKVTVVCKKRNELPNIVTGGKDTVGIRVPNFPFLNAFMVKISFPFIGTSANISGEETFPDGNSAFLFFKEEQFQPDLIIDGGRLSLSKPSTVVDLTSLALLREGAASKDDIVKWWGECMIEKTT
jgi:L-threonylcarbamoyladenylate synthase